MTASVAPPAGRAGGGRRGWPLQPWHWPWPAPALLAWSAGWLLWLGGTVAAVPPALALALALAGSVALAWPCGSGWRRLIAAAGFPLSAAALAPSAAWPPWLWLLLMAPLLAAYPMRAWRDAPLYPTPAQALAGLDGVVGMPRRVLDAGCGLGHGLRALQRLWPQAQLEGVEWSRPWAWLAARRCPRARIVRGDMWVHPWAGYELVYLFQRPESMARAWAKATREMPSQAWLVSLEFAVPGVQPHACLQGPGRRPLWIYATGGANKPSIAGGQGR